ncbi:MAG TPA: DUF4389 domain-containing protein [Conexibacter sp.]|nr:DUF4389 domain-containing protein [Conexibacter sp.]
MAYEADYVEQRSRLSTFFRLILAIPWFIVSIFWGLVALVCVVIAWFAIVLTGRYPEGLYKGVSMALRFATRMNGFALLMTDAFPPFGGEENPEYPVRLQIAAPLEAYSRVKTLLRIILVIPIAIVLYFVQIVSRAISILAWLVIVITGKLPRGIFDVMRFTLAYEARASAYQLLVTETYPPFSPDEEAPGAPLAPPVSPPPAI